MVYPMFSGTFCKVIIRRWCLLMKNYNLPLDNLLSRIDARKLGIVAAVLLVLYCADQVYSAQHPNVGAGITDYKGSDTSLEAPTPYEIRKRSDGLS